MFKNKHIDGKCNRCGEQIAKLRKQLPDKTSQRILADRMQEKGIDMDKNAIQRIEHGDRFVTDIELAAHPHLNLRHKSRLPPRCRAGAALPAHCPVQAYGARPPAPR